MKRQLIIALTIFLLTAGICSADNYVGGIPLTTVKDGTVSGGVYFDSYYGTGAQAKENPITIDKTFTLPDNIDVEWAMLLTTVYCGTMQDNQQGVANVIFNGASIGDETLNVPFVYKKDEGDGYVWVNDHVVRVTSDYMMWYDVTTLVQAGDNTASVHTEQIDASFDGRIKLITLIAAYNDGSSKTIHYWVNRGHDVDSHYSDDNLGEDYIGSTTFTAGFPSGATIQDAHLTAVHIASTDGSYTFNGNSIASGTPQGSYSGSNTWDVASSFVPDGTNTLTYDRVGASYKIALGILTAEYLEPTEEKSDLLVSDIIVKHNYYNGAWVDLSNSVNVTVANNGEGGAGSFNVALYADGAEVESKSVSGLAAGVSTVVSFDWTPNEVKTYTLKAEVDPDNAVLESDETNNELTESQDVGYNGYVGDKPLTTYAHETITGDIIYTYGNSQYSGMLYTDDTYTVNHDITLPAGATIKFARLYNYWTWSGTGTTGKNPVMSLTFDGSTISPEVEYDDTKGWGSFYDFPTGTWAYNVTNLVTGSGTYTTVVTNTNSDAFFCMDGLGLLVVYEDPSGQVVDYWINEGADMISTKDTSGGLTPEEATVTSMFQGSVDLGNVASARLWTVVQAGGDLNDKLLFNNMNWTGVYDSTPYSDLDIDEERAVEDYLTANDNTAWISGAPYPSGDVLTPSNAFLVITYSGTPSPALSVSADLDTVTVGVPTDVNFTVTNNSELVEGATITLTGSATGSATTDTNGTAVISVNATGSGTITATAIKDGFISATTTITAEVEHSGVSSSVSMTTNIIPAIALVVTPGNIEFGELSPGDTSGAHTLTLENTGGNGLSVTAEVSDTTTDSNLFAEGMLLDSDGWGDYSTSIAALDSDTTDASLKVPDDYLGVGAKQGALVFWGEAE
jgi:hypothetical protein